MLLDRFAGYRLTGTLTSPNAMVPVQKPRLLAPPLSGSDSFAVLRLRSGNLALPGETGAQRRCQIVPLPGWCGLPEAHGLSARLALDELHDARSILVAIVLRIELAFEHGHELPGHGQLALARS